MDNCNNNKWDYNCPQFVDFNTLNSFNGNGDDIFDRVIVGDGAIEHHHSDPIMEVQSKSSNVSSETGGYGNINGKQSGPDSRLKGRQVTKNNDVQSETSNHQAKHTNTLISDDGPPNKKSCSSLSEEIISDGLTKNDSVSKVKKVSRVPSMLKRISNNPSSSAIVKSTEERELEKIGHLRNELHKKRMLSQQSLLKNKSKPLPMSVRSGCDVTIPKVFNFQTSKRVKGLGQASDGSAVCDFTKTLRSRTVSSQKWSSEPKRCTVPQPFRVAEKAAKSVPVSKFQSLAEQVTAFHRQTPDRYRTRSASNDRLGRGSRQPSPSCHSVTKPHTPQLATKGRSRLVCHPSREEVEAKELEEIKRNKFKAKPVNSRILNNPRIGVKKVESRPLTEPEEFALTSNLPKKVDMEERETEKHEFHARPVNQKMLDGPMGVRSVKPAPLTNPMSPAFALKHKLFIPIDIPDDDKLESSLKSAIKPVPHTGVPFQPKLSHQHTVPEPFTVEGRSKVMLAQKEERIKQVLDGEKKAREFHAQPLPSQEPGILPDRNPKELTRHEPFKLETELRGHVYQQDFDQKMTVEVESMQKVSKFKAQPNSVIYKDAFVPEKSSKPATEIEDFELNSDRRAVDRTKFEMQKTAREMELVGIQRQRERRQQEEEEAIVSKLRTEMVHKSNPVRRFRSVEVKPSDKSLTAPESPKFSDRLRSNVHGK